MRTIPLLAPLFAFTVAFAAYGCTLDVQGASPATSSAGGAGPSSSSASGPGGDDATATTGNGTTTAASTSGTGCVAKTEDCTNGVDDDCDDDIDCADADCSGATGTFQCAPDTTGGWKVVSLANDPAAQCSAGYENLAVVASAPLDSAQGCACSCGNLPTNPCTQGALSIAFGIMGCGGATITGVATGGCDALSGTVGSTNGTSYATAGTDVLPPKQIACNATATLPVNPPVGAATCTPTVLTGAGCTGQAACVPKVAGASVCIQHDGAVSCPSGGPQQRLIVGAPGDVIDGRTCTQCSCNSAATSCTSPTLTGYDDANCTVHPVTIDVDGTCNFAMNGQTFTKNTHFVYSATPSPAGCVPTSVTTAVGGAFTVNNPVTICCP